MHIAQAAQVRIVRLVTRLKIEADGRAEMISRAFQEIDAEHVETLREDPVVVGNIERWQRQDLERTRTRVFR